MDITSWNEVVITNEHESKSGNICIWDMETDSTLVKFKGGSSYSHCLSTIGNDYILSALEGSNALNVYQFSKTGKIECQIDCPGKVTALAVSSDGSYCVGAISSKLYVWKVRTGELRCILKKHFDNVNCIKFTHDGKYFVSGGKDCLAIAWDLNNVVTVDDDDGDNKGKAPPETFMHMWSDHYCEITDIHVGYFGYQARVATVSLDMNCNVYDLESGDLLFYVNTSKPLCSVVMDPVEYFLFLGTNSGDIIQLSKENWSSTAEVHVTDEHEGMHSGHSEAVTCLSVSMDGRLLLSASSDTTVVIWDIFSWSTLHVFEHTGAVSNAFFALSPYSLLSGEEVPPKIKVKPFKSSIAKLEDKVWEVKLKPCIINPPSQRVNNDILQAVKGANITKDEDNTEVKWVDSHRVNEQLYGFSGDAVLSFFHL